MGGCIRYTEEFKLGAVAQVTDKGYSVTSVIFSLKTSIPRVFMSSPKSRKLK